ncbi:hypothetical protein HYN46_11665 [Aquirhabdus parva]|uniref:Uncharacterized protein n=2 Tax=Aquirhabdus parva TaxID=2283318 RepID=A0A345P828_9GAMM|nr:hypothetical protein HYN46_11665 [Aquirhabdus parva]
MERDAVMTDPKEKLARQREAYIRLRMRQIKVWNMVGWLFWVFLAVACYWLYQQKPLYLDPSLLANQVQVGKMPSNEMAQLAALGGLLFWAFIALLAGFIFQIYTAMYSERKLIRLFAALHADDLKQYEPRVEISDVTSPNGSQS